MPPSFRDMYSLCPPFDHVWLLRAKCDGWQVPRQASNAAYVDFDSEDSSSLATSASSRAFSLPATPLTSPRHRANASVFPGRSMRDEPTASPLGGSPEEEVPSIGSKAEPQVAPVEVPSSHSEGPPAEDKGSEKQPAALEGNSWELVD